MKRYRVTTTPRPDLAPKWNEFLQSHVPEVVLAGSFTGAEVFETGAGVACDYSAPEGTLERYVAERAPALRDDADRRFPEGVTRARETARVTMKVSAPYPWGSLGLVDAAGAPVAAPSDGPFLLAYYAAWCEECVDRWAEIVDRVRAAGDRGALVAVYMGADEVAADARAKASGLTIWREPSAKDEVSRLRTMHAFLRQAGGDARKWGVPAFRELFLEGGRFVVAWK